MFGGGVDKTTGANVCSAASGHECGIGAHGSAPGQFGSGFKNNDVSVGPTGSVFVGDNERIEEFEPDGTFKAQIPVPGEAITDLSVGPDGNFYAAFWAGTEATIKPDVRKLSPSGAQLSSFSVDTLRTLATDSSGRVYAVNGIKGAPNQHPPSVLEFGAGGDQMSNCCTPEHNFTLNGLAVNGSGTLYITENGFTDIHISAFGPPPLNFEGPPRVAPTIAAQYAASVDTHSATVRAQINPHFWGDLHYYVEYGTGKCSEGGCDQKQPLPPGALLTSKAVDGLITSAGVSLAGLQPATTYHYRVVAQSGGGGPVFGIDPDGEGPEEASAEDGLEGTFKTFPESEPSQTNCPNQGFRTGASALLPDCRAYEMVSPVDKENGDILAPIDIVGFETRLNQSSLDGEKMTYSSYRAFGGAKGAPYISQYIASRGSEGWSTEALEEPRGPSFYGAPSATENEFKAFSPDLCQAWLRREAEPQLAAGAVTGFPNLYRRHNCPSSYEALTTVPPPNVQPISYMPELQGVSSDSSKAIFRVEDKLTADAVAGKYQVYEASGGALRSICIMPDETPYAGDCSAGSPGQLPERTASVSHAISADGSRIYWSTTRGESGLGKIFLRLDGATTVEVSGKASSAEAQFWGASADGSKALFSIDDGEPPITALNQNLYEYDLGEEKASLIAGKAIGVAGASEDLSYVYFVSEEAIGGKGTAGKANLYLRHEGTNTFVATLSEDDARVSTSVHNHGGLSPIPSDTAPQPVWHAARATPDGRHLTFISTEPLSGFDNTDANSGKADSEVFTYAADTETLNCVSCSPAGANPEGRIVQASANSGLLWTAASIPAGESQLYTPRAISEDGNRLFFNSYADILPADANGAADVYEWERPGSGSCEEGDADYFESSGGCLYLISSGQSPQDSELVDASADGHDVFIATGQSLLAPDPGLIDIYDVRAGGGFPAQAARQAPCEGEACQPQVSAPNFKGPVSDVPGPSNPPASRHGCPKGKHRLHKGDKGRCVRDKHGHDKNKKKTPGKGRRAPR
jgi:hypothetical protein